MKQKFKTADRLSRVVRLCRATINTFWLFLDSVVFDEVILHKRKCVCTDHQPDIIAQSSLSHCWPNVVNTVLKKEGSHLTLCLQLCTRTGFTFWKQEQEIRSVLRANEHWLLHLDDILPNSSVVGVLLIILCQEMWASALFACGTSLLFTSRSLQRSHSDTSSWLLEFLFSFPYIPHSLWVDPLSPRSALVQNTYTNADKLLEAAEQLAQTGECDPEEIYQAAHQLEDRIQDFVRRVEQRKVLLDMSVAFHTHVKEVGSGARLLGKRVGERALITA